MEIKGNNDLDAVRGFKYSIHVIIQVKRKYGLYLAQSNGHRSLFLFCCTKGKTTFQQRSLCYLIDANSLKRVMVNLSRNLF